MPSIHVRDLTLVRGGRVLLDGVNLSVDDAQALAIVGPPGAGKSLLLQVLAGLEEPTSGEILVDDRDATDDSPRRRDLSMVFQDFALHPKRDVYDNLGFAATLRRGHDREELADRIEDVAELLALTNDLEERPAALDVGRYERFAVFLKGHGLIPEARPASAYAVDLFAAEG